MDKTFAHFGYVVAKMDQAIKRWTNAGATVIVPPADDPIQKVSCALLITDDKSPIELVAPLSEDSPVQTRLKKGGGLDHVCYYVDDVAAALAAAESRGAMIIVEPVYGAVFDRTIAFVQDRTGLVTEYMSKHAIGKLPEDPLKELDL